MTEKYASIKTERDVVSEFDVRKRKKSHRIVWHLRLLSLTWVDNDLTWIEVDVAHLHWYESNTEYNIEQRNGMQSAAQKRINS